MRLIREITENVPQPISPDEGWNVGHLAHHGILLSCDGFVVKLDLDQLNVLFDFAESGDSGEVRDHDGDVIYVEVTNNSIVLSRNGDEVYPNGVVLDLDTLKAMGIETHEDATNGVEDQPAVDSDDSKADDTIDTDEEPNEEADSELEEGVKRAYRRVGNKIKRGFRVTSGWRKGRVVSSAKAASAPRAKASTRMKLKIAAKRKKVVRILKGKRTSRKSTSKRLTRLNKK